VAVPWAGTIFAAGRQLSEVEAEIEDSLRNYLRFPDCSLNIDEFGPNLVYIAGEVGLPGSYEINGGQTVLGSIAQAGGFLTTASWQEVVLLRRVSETKATVHRINVERALRGADNFMDPVVQHMDILFVPRTLIADINIFVDQFFRQITPIFTFYLAGWEAFNRQNVETIRVSRFVP